MPEVTLEEWLVELRRPWVRRAVHYGAPNKEAARARALMAMLEDDTFHLARVCEPGPARRERLVIRFRDKGASGGAAFR